MKIEEAWKHFKDYHDRFAKQRVDAFNFSLILFGLMLNIIVTLSIEAWKRDAEQPQWLFGIILIIIAIFIIVAAIMFLGVDYRTMCFIKKAKEKLRSYEENITIVSTAKKGKVSTDVSLPFTIDKEVRDRLEKKGDESESDDDNKKHIHAKLGTLIKFTYVGFIIIGIISIIEGICLFIF